jgi:TRAP-type C4-dicarboxylate transport system substrate-binding protein
MTRHSARSHLAFLARTLLVICLAALLAPASFAQTITIKMATLAPEGTTWYNGMRQMGERWSEISGGKVQLKIYAGGVAGNEGTQVRKMRIGQLHAAGMSNLGLLDIDPGPQVINTPMLIRSYDELDCVMQAITPTLEQRLLDKGFVVLSWSDAGWSYYFNREPVRTPADASRYKVFAWEGDPAAVIGFRKAGFNPVVVQSVEVIPSLQSGLIDGFFSTPLATLSLQWFALAPNMLSVPWAPLTGATVITQDAWDAIPAEYHEPFLQAAREVGASLKDEIRRQDGAAIKVMEKYGLNVVEADEAVTQEWNDMAVSLYPYFREEIVPPDVFDLTQKTVEACRAR